MSLDYMFISPNVLENGMSNVDIARLDRTLKQVVKPFELKTAPTAAQVIPINICRLAMSSGSASSAKAVRARQSPCGPI